MDYSTQLAEQFQNMDPLSQKIFAVVFLAALLLLIVAEWMIFTKAGEKGWKSLIPVYRSYILVKIADGNGWKFLLLLIPFVNIVYGIMMNYRLARAFGKGTGFTFGLVLVPNIFTLILGLGKAQYIAPRGEAHKLGVPENIKRE